MAQITYQNKVALNPQPSIADANKVTDNDMNEIKTVVNTNATTLDNLIVTTNTASDSNAYSCNYINNTLEDYQTKGEIIWTNPSPNAEFANQPINFTDTYSYYDITFRQDGQIMKTQRCYVDANFNYNLETIYGGYIRTRDLRAYNNRLYFGNGFFYQTYGGTGTTNNNQCIPYQIIGYK